jgi:actin-like ATPase involved in cell morphogenesis
VDFGGGACRAAAVEGTECQTVCSVPVPLLFVRGSPGRTLPWRRESAKRHTGMEQVVDADGRICKTDDLLKSVFAEVRKQCERKLKAVVRGAAISVPSCFTDRQRQATIRCAEAAGFTKVAVVDDSQAAVLDYTVRTKRRGRWLLYGMGQTAFFTTLLENAEARRHNGTLQLGGDDLDAALAEDLARRGITLPAGTGTSAKLFADSVRQIKEEVVRTGSVRLPQVAGAPSITMQFLEKACSSRIADTVRMAEQTLEDGGVTMADVDALLLLGGSTRLPFVRQRLMDALSPKEVEELPADSVARGAALLAAARLESCFERKPESDVPPLPERLIEAWRQIHYAQERHDLAEAIRHYESFIAAARNDVGRLYLSHADELAAESKRDSDVEALLKKSLENAPQDRAVRQRLARFYRSRAQANIEASRRPGMSIKDLKSFLKACEDDIALSNKYDPNNPQTASVAKSLKDHRRRLR